MYNMGYKLKEQNNIYDWIEEEAHRIIKARNPHCSTESAVYL